MSIHTTHKAQSEDMTDSDPSSLFPHMSAFNYAITHVFFPVQLPEHDDYTLDNDLSLARAVLTIAHSYIQLVPEHSKSHWHRVVSMLGNLETFLRSERLENTHIIAQLQGMQTGDILVFFVRHQDAALTIIRQENTTLWEYFGAPSSGGSRICSYPESGVEIYNEVFDDKEVQCQLGDSLYFAKLLPEILQRIGHIIDVHRITKHVRLNIREDHKRWQRSPLWLLIRVAIQITIERSLGRTSYKEFVLFFISTLAVDPNHEMLPNGLLHLMECKILRRLAKLGPSTPNWLSELALKTCSHLRQILDAKWGQPSSPPAPFRNPSQDELARDSLISFPSSHEYIHNALSNSGCKSAGTPFNPNHHRRGTIDDFLSSDGAFFEEAYRTDPDVTLFDVERLVEEGIDDWVTCITDIDEACAQLATLMDKYIEHAGHRSTGALTSIELFLALDKLAVGEIPLLADYSPEIPTHFLERLKLRGTSLHRLSRAYQYLSARHSWSHPGWSVLSDEFTEDSFPVRYYDQSLHLQLLKSQIERDVVQNSRSLLPISLLQAKVVVFELQCPAYIRIWRSAALSLLHSFRSPSTIFAYWRLEGNLLAHSPGLQPYFSGKGELHQTPHLKIRFCYPPLCYALQKGSDSCLYFIERGIDLWSLRNYDYEINFSGYSNVDHTPNHALATQIRCPTNFSLEEFITLAQLRNCGSLQWLNILHGIRSRTLNLCHDKVYHLLTHVVLQVGPLDLDTGVWIWHQELEDVSFCNALLDELDALFMDLRESMDVILMGSMSLLFARVLASSPSECVSKRVVQLLRNIRSKTFLWVEEMLYNLAMAPTNAERSRLLVEVAATCRSTFDIDPSCLTKALCSVEDVDAALSCALFISALRSEISPGSDDTYSGLLLQRHQPLSLALEGILSDVIPADPSEYGIDLAVHKLLGRYQSCTNRWKKLQPPNDRWLNCKTELTKDQPSQAVHLNLLTGTLQIDGKHLTGLPLMIMDTPECREIFRDQGFIVIPSSLPGVDFMTHTVSSKHKVHYSLRDQDPLIQVQCNGSLDILQLIPSHVLKRDLPIALIYHYVHWLNLSSRIIEIRPLKHLWEESPDNWRIDCTKDQYRIYKGSEALVDTRSPTWTMISQCFKPLRLGVKKLVYWDEPGNLLITTSPTDSLQSLLVLRLSVALPHYGLSFFVNAEGDLESCDFRNMIYDENQSIGTLFGLENFLVLRSKFVIAGTPLPEALIPRRVLVPNGIPKRYNSHCVRVDPAAFRKGSFCHIYDVDAELGCLIGNGSLASTQYLACLHAATSCDTRPDPLTSKTGIQTAYGLLHWGGCWSVMRHRELDSVRDVVKNRKRHFAIAAQYPQFAVTYKEIEGRYHWHRRDRLSDQSSRSLEHSMQRAAYLFPPNVTRRPITESSDSELGHVLQVASRPVASRSHEPTRWPVTYESLLADRPVPILPTRNPLLRDSYQCKPEGNNRLADDVLKLESRIFSSVLTDHSFQREYLSHLHASSQCIHNESLVTRARVVGKECIEAFRSYYMECKAIYMQALATLKQALTPPPDPLAQAIDRSGQWPQVGATDLLQCLAPASLICVPPRWKECLISFALLLLDLQRSRRLLRFALYGLEEDLSKELTNAPCDGWNPEEYPDWLLIQIQGNFCIRRAQAETAMELMSPQSGENTVMQVNMGEGKSSVIIPIAAAALANGKQLVRVVVPQALTAQMFDILVSRLGGLANRPIYHLPFSRRSRIYGLEKLMSQCMAERGILLLQPEHVVSLKLMSLEQICEQKSVTEQIPMDQKWIYKLSSKSLTEGTFMGNIFRWLGQLRNRSMNDDSDTPRGDCDDQGTASRWFKLQKWVQTHCRDILDESDEILHARFQLMYTIGAQQHMDGYPHRWTIIQHILKLVKRHTYSLSMYSPHAVEYESGPQASFPYIHILRASDVGQSLASFIAEDVMVGEIPGLNFEHVPPRLHDAIQSFMLHDVLQLPDTAERVEQYAKNSHQSYLWSGLLLLRGLLASEILVFALSEWRWRVNYGLHVHPTRTDDCDDYPLSRSEASAMLAVPYRAKDTPAPNTQFGHPDITIILTYLSYYYTGLTEDQLRTSFKILLDEDDPAAEYTQWVKDYDDSLPKALQELSEINLQSSEQWDNVTFPLFARNQATVDFYLSRVVFPKEAKEFPWKLSGSSWDLAEKREKLITGFSGTNDSRWLLPTSIAQYDLKDQKGTNARILGYLLRPENDCYRVTYDSGSGERRSTRGLLKIMANQEPEIRILLDVGAQILDLANKEVAGAWLEISSNISGAIYFDENNELMVLTREGTTLPLLSSPLSQTLERCVVYLDHVHTRGTDLKFPNKSRAAVTLGPKVTKDNLVQGCMRMRRLGHGHSVMFFAPPDVDRSIRAVAGKQDPTIRIATLDILFWTIHETWTDIQQRAPHWAQQGMNHKSRHESWTRFSDGDLTRGELSKAWLQPDRKSLLELYGSSNTENYSSALSTLDPEIRQRCEALGVLSLPSAQLEEQQEREVNREREREREVELPPEAKPAEHYVHPDVGTFVKTGIIPPLHFGGAFQPVFTSLEKSTAATRDADVWSPFILATADFCQTIKPESTRGTLDQYLRPVQWVLTSERMNNRALVLLSPFEVHKLLPIIRVSECVHLHLYAPRTSQRMKPSDDLKLYTIPPLPDSWTPPWNLIDQLNVFSGQLYLRDYQSYLRLCRFLGVPTKDSPNDATARWNLFNIPGNFEENEIRFSESPLPAVMALLGIRRKGRPFAHTHMGRILQGQVLKEEDFEGSTSGGVTATRDSATRDQRPSKASHHVLPQVAPSLSLDVDCDNDHVDTGGSGSSALLSSTGKRRTDTTGSDGLDADAEPLRKRLRTR